MHPKYSLANIPHEIKLNDCDFPGFLEDKTVAVDMGCGVGDFMIRNTQIYPEKLFVGVEIWRKRVLKTAERLAKRNIDNFRVISSMGEVALKSLFPCETVDEMHVNFPTPWLRERQWKNRILKPSFLCEIHRVLKTGGELSIVTDVDYYASEVSAFLSDFPGFENVYDAPFLLNLEPDFPTLFFDKMSPVSNIHYIRFKKVDL